MKKTLKILNKITLTLLAFAFIVSSCTMEKRHYLSGYYIHSKNVKEENKDENIKTQFSQNKLTKQKDSVRLNTINNANDNSKNLNYSEKGIIPDNEEEKNKEMLASTDNNQIYFSTTIPLVGNNKTSQLLDSCDNIIFKNGDEIAAKIIEIGIDNITFKKCDYQDGPTIVIKKADVFMIKYKNGTKAVFSTNTENLKKEYKGKGSTGYSVGSFIFGISGLLVLAIIFGPLAIIFGVIGLNRKLKGLAIVGLLLGFIDIIGFLIIISGNV